MEVNISKSYLDNFRRRARNTPNEIYALLIGKKLSPTKILVTSIEYPTLLKATPDGVEADIDSCNAIEAKAHLRGLKWLGSIHSHPDYLPVMSDTDMRNHVFNKDLVRGIVEVTKRRTRVVFWRHDSSLPCELTYT